MTQFTKIIQFLTSVQEYVEPTDFAKMVELQGGDEEFRHLIWSSQDTFKHDPESCRIIAMTHESSIVDDDHGYSITVEAVWSD